MCWRCVFSVIFLTQAGSTGSSVDPDKPVEHMEVQQSGSGTDSAPAQNSPGEKGTKGGNKDTTTASDSPAVPPPKRW